MRIALANFTRRAGMLLASAALVFAAVFVFSSGAAAASVRTQKKAAASVAVAAKTAAPVQSKAAAAKPAESAAKGMSTGIKIHGHWVINVLTPGGKLVSHTEFENSIQINGAHLLATVLSQQQEVGAWGIALLGSAGPCLNGGNCTIVQSGTGISSCSGCSPSLTLSDASQSAQETLSGTFTFPSAGNITRVDTLNEGCPSALSMQACLQLTPTLVQLVGAVFSGSSSFPGAPVAVGAGQIVQVTVTFSFS